MQCQPNPRAGAVAGVVLAPMRVSRYNGVVRGENMPTVGIRELKEKLSVYVDQVKAGYTVTITEGGKPVGRIVPVRSSLEDKEQQLADSGLLAWSGRPFRPRMPSIKPRGARTVSELLLEDRD